MEKRYKRIGEVSKITGVPKNILRQWEREFPKLKPVKRGGFRYYSPEDIELILKIKELIYDRGYTVEGARKRLEEKVSDEERGFLSILETIKKDLMEIKEFLDETDT